MKRFPWSKGVTGVKAHLSPVLIPSSFHRISKGGSSSRVRSYKVFPVPRVGVGLPGILGRFMWRRFIYDIELVRGLNRCVIVSNIPSVTFWSKSMGVKVKDAVSNAPSSHGVGA